MTWPTKLFALTQVPLRCALRQSPSGLPGGLLCLLVLLAWGSLARAQAPAEEPVAKDLREEIQRIGVTVKDLYGRQETRQIPVTIFRPAGEGPFPLVIMNHGRAVSGKRALQGRQRYEILSRYLVSKGFVVLIPTRVGYAETYGDFDPEASGSCNAVQVEPMATAASDQVLATLAFARSLPYVDASRWLVAGQSVGGLTAVATVWRHPPGLVGGINFAGGVGGNPEVTPGSPCSPMQVTRLLDAKAMGSMVPMLWLYWQNDLYWGPDNPRRWHDAWARGGGKAELHTLAAAGEDGHGAMNFDMDHWVPIAEAFLAKLGFDRPGVIARPPATSFAQVDEADKLPANAATRDDVYRKFLSAKTPRAFAIGPKGSSGWASGDWAVGRALGYCQRRGETCKLYAVDDDVVWVPSH
ncbi:MAG TPA: hypothetical protein VE029_06245 [Rhizobacter sp.]|nr:hypothetical protein [Rhizobacter sp.]